MTPAKKAEKQHLIDSENLGKRIRAARILAGHENIGTVTGRMREELELSVSDRTLYAVERGEQIPTWDLMVALVLVLEPPGGVRFFWPGIAPKHVQRFMELSTESEPASVQRTAERAYYEAIADLTRERAQ